MGAVPTLRTITNTMLARWCSLALLCVAIVTCETSSDFDMADKDDVYTTSVMEFTQTMDLAGKAKVHIPAKVKEKLMKKVKKSREKESGEEKNREALHFKGLIRSQVRWSQGVGTRERVAPQAVRANQQVLHEDQQEEILGIQQVGSQAEQKGWRSTAEAVQSQRDDAEEVCPRRSSGLRATRHAQSCGASTQAPNTGRRA